MVVKCEPKNSAMTKRKFGGKTKKKVSVLNMGGKTPERCSREPT